MRKVYEKMQMIYLLRSLFRMKGQRNVVAWLAG